ncbi:MAG: alpha amylase C-terminal domain-containing protein [Prevotellaceae bacterium]|jgi:glycosidase|nr:alpha amylase C-terminal domain-containing protein [Prevotellaceae bacterium]
MRFFLTHVKQFALAIALATTLSLASCNNAATSTTSTAPAVEPFASVEWSKDATIYEVNLRQYTPEGTLAAFQRHLPRLQQLGVKILWFMPISPIGKVDKKGTLGSYYSISDYCAINPEFGTMEDFKLMVMEAHSLGMKVIIDWVANHTSRDHEWVKAHPDWYVAGKDGKPIGPYDWTDVAQLNYAGKDMQKEMIKSMAFWLTEADIDGFRCDVAGLARDYVTEEQTVSFWEDARKALDTVKPVFMLAEDEALRKLLYSAFDANYAWEFHHMMNHVAQGKASVKDIQKYFEREVLNTQTRSCRMMFTSNHDENSWNGTEFMRMGDAAKAMAALSFTVPGFPLIYSGQEVGFKRSLEFFEKDAICWNDADNFSKLYQNLTALKANHSALHNGAAGADMVWVNNNREKKVLMFVREDDNSKIFCVFNLSNKVLKDVEPQGDAYYGKYNLACKGISVEFSSRPSFILNPWEYRIYATKK